MAIHKVFVYGTLKKGYRYHYLLAGIKGHTAVAPHINIHAGTHYPYAVRGTGVTIGEMYEVEDDVLKELDRLEEHPDYYYRELTPIILANGQQVAAWIYLNPSAYQYPLIIDGFWLE